MSVPSITFDVRVAKPASTGNGEGGLAVDLRLPRGDRRVLAILDGPDVRQRVRGHRHRADRLVREHVEADARICLHPLAVQQRAGGDADRRVQVVIEELTAGARGHATDARQGRRVTVIPRVRPIDAVDGLRDDPSLPTREVSGNRQYIK